MILIASAAYIVPEFRDEIGNLPPCLLPLGNRKLIEYQVEELRKISPEVIFVTLPESYTVSPHENELFNQLNIKIIAVKENISLHASLAYALNSINIDNITNLRLLHGDTLILNLPKGLDLLSLGNQQGDYSWETEITTSNYYDEVNVWSGYFAFSNVTKIYQSLIDTSGGFVEAIREYGKIEQMKKIVCTGWFDCGHINTYFQSRSKITTQRSFNFIKINDGVVFKTGLPNEKIQAEITWLNTIPPSIKKYTPQLIDFGNLNDGHKFYTLEYLPFLPLNELFVHGKNHKLFWDKQFLLLKKFFLDSRQGCISKEFNQQNLTADIGWLYKEKTIERLNRHINEVGIDPDKILGKHKGINLSLNLLTLDCINRTLALPIVPSIMHGDLCFSNILYNSRSEKIKLIDPRGMFRNGKFSIYGDQKYDLAKLAHSIVGMYDHIISNDYLLSKNSDGHEQIDFYIDKRTKDIQEEFYNTRFIDHISVADIMPLVVLLFVSMLPLHSTRCDHQKAMLLNAIRIYKELVIR